MLGLERIIDKLFEIWSTLIPFEIIEYYDRGVKLRLGKPTMKAGKIKILEPGLHWKIPFVDVILSHRVVAKTMDLTEQSITTKDSKSVVVRSVLKYEVDDVATILLEVDSAEEAVKDMCQGILMDAMSERTWEECQGPELTKQVKEKIKVEAKKWGIRIKAFTLTDLSIMRSIRLLNSTRYN
jgi:regulator of protease activity HflC (stomatin/prohibitin superfamily)